MVAQQRRQKAVRNLRAGGRGGADNPASVKDTLDIRRQLIASATKRRLRNQGVRSMARCRGRRRLMRHPSEFGTTKPDNVTNPPTSPPAMPDYDKAGETPAAISPSHFLVDSVTNSSGFGLQQGRRRQKFRAYPAAQPPSAAMT